MKKRQSNFELLRIIAIVMIVLGHIAGQSGAAESVLASNRIIATLFGNGARIAVEIFLLIGCWFMVSSKFKASRFVRLWLQTLVIVAPLAVIGYIFAPEYRSIKSLAFSFMPIMGTSLWYASVYLILILASPFLALYCQKVSERVMCVTIMVGGCFCCIMPTFVGFHEDTIMVCEYYFMYTYLLTYYLKKLFLP